MKIDRTYIHHLRYQIRDKNGFVTGVNPRGGVTLGFRLIHSKVTGTYFLVGLKSRCSLQDNFRRKVGVARIEERVNRGQWSSMHVVGHGNDPMEKLLENAYLLKEAVITGERREMSEVVQKRVEKLSRPIERQLNKVTGLVNEFSV